MTGSDMLSTLGLRLEDSDETSFPEQIKLDALNIAQKTVVNLVHNGYLGELQTISNNKTAGQGDRYSTCTFSTAFGAALPIRNGITAIFDETNDKWCTMIEPGEVKTLENSYLNGDTTNPVAYVFADKIYVKPTTVTSIDVWYIKAPTDLAANATECELNPALQEMVLDFAESQLWRMDGKSDRANIAYNNGINTVKVLNERYQVELATSIGRKGK